MNLHRSEAGLIKHLQKHSRGDVSFPDPACDYFLRYKSISDHLNKKVHPHVNQGASIEGQGKNGICLTDHGADHVATVIRRASDLLSGQNPPPLTPYETYILLLSAHFHDTGNVFGREGHEKQLDRILGRAPLTGLLGDDTIEIRMIRNIAMAHGGYASGSKDTIGPLPYPQPSGSGEVRVRLLAATLRFADELAEDYTRASRFLAENDLIPQDSQLHHQYADRLRRVHVNPQGHFVNLLFELNKQISCVKTFKKGSNKIYLYDEILQRCLKMHREHVYCGRFLRPTVMIDAIHVTLNLCSDDYLKTLETLEFSMAEGGYPEDPRTIEQVAPMLKCQSASDLSAHFP